MDVSHRSGRIWEALPLNRSFVHIKRLILDQYPADSLGRVNFCLSDMCHEGC